MNRVFVSGIVKNDPLMKMEANEAAHMVFHLEVCHKNRNGKMIHEKYPVNAWHNVATWASANLKQDQRIMVTGYLTQRFIKIGESHVGFVEITADEIVISKDLSKEENKMIVEGDMGLNS